jgi:hypothetical protein
MVSPIPKLRIPAKGASGRSFNPDDIHLGSAQPSKSEKWLKTPIIIRFTIPQRTWKKKEMWNEEMKPTKAHLPNNKNLRITMISEGIHKVMHNMPKRVYFPNLRYD